MAAETNTLALLDLLSMWRSEHERNLFDIYKAYTVVYSITPFLDIEK